MMRGSRAPLTVPNPLMLFTVPSAFRYRLVGAPLSTVLEGVMPVACAKLSVELIPLN